MLCGGGPAKTQSGYYVQPTILTDLTDDMKVSREEVSFRFFAYVKEEKQSYSVSKSRVSTKHKHNHKG